MNYKVLFRAEAEEELLEAAGWYEERLKGLGSAFLLSIEAAIDSISRNPESYPKIHKNIRRALIRRFPFGIYYFVEKERIIVLAVFHAHRNPKEWRKRIS